MPGDINNNNAGQQSNKVRADIREPILPLLDQIDAELAAMRAASVAFWQQQPVPEVLQAEEPAIDEQPAIDNSP